MITQKYLKEKVEYNSLTGNFVWINATKSNINLNGTKAGSVNGNGYLQVTISGKIYQNHRLAFLYMTGSMPNEQVDHIDHQKTNNVWSNLRLASRKENSQNRPLQVNSKCSCFGIRYIKSTNKYAARIGVNKKEIFLGSYNLYEDAVSARRNAEKLYGFHENHGTV